MAREISDTEPVEKPMTSAEFITLAGTIGAGAGASVAIQSGVTGAAWTATLAAGGAGVAAAGIAGWKIGSFIGDIPWVRENILKMMEGIVPIGSVEMSEPIPIPPPPDNLDALWRMDFGDFGQRDVYWMATGSEGYQGQGGNAYADPFEAIDHAMSVGIIGGGGSGLGWGCIYPTVMV